MESLLQEYKQWLQIDEIRNRTPAQIAAVLKRKAGAKRVEGGHTDKTRAAAAQSIADLEASQRGHIKAAIEHYQNGHLDKAADKVAAAREKAGNNKQAITAINSAIVRDGVYHYIQKAWDAHQAGDHKSGEQHLQTAEKINDALRPHRVNPNAHFETADHINSVRKSQGGTKQSLVKRLIGKMPKAQTGGSKL